MKTQQELDAYGDGFEDGESHNNLPWKYAPYHVAVWLWNDDELRPKYHWLRQWRKQPGKTRYDWPTQDDLDNWRPPGGE